MTAARVMLSVRYLVNYLSLLYKHNKDCVYRRLFTNNKRLLLFTNKQVMCSISKHFSKQETRLSLYDTPCIPSRAYRCRPLATKTGFWWYPTFYRMVFSHIPTNFWLPSVHLAPGTITNGYQDRRKTESVYSSTNRATHLCKCNGMVDP